MTLRDDCFALPQGVTWTPVDAALARLQAGLAVVAGTEDIALAHLAGRILAADVFAERGNPPTANSAVDGYGFDGALLQGGDLVLPVVAARAAAGVQLTEAVPRGSAIRILTGAALPEGVDTVVLDEDCLVRDGFVSFSAGLKPNANARAAGEDVAAGTCILPAGTCVGPTELALMSAVGIRSAAVHRRLRVAVLSTGDELVEAGAVAELGQIYDANRPMLSALAEGWGYDVLDLGRAADDADMVRAALDRGAAEADVILTSGGASAGDEDHVARILGAEGQLQTWRIALKPGRPLALALWHGVPVFGLPGNPVAALVCALIFARPALSVLAGGDWSQPLAVTVPAGFAKRKKAGRREYLRARLTAEGHAEVFASEGSGRISGLAWADGLVELPDEALEIQPGDPVRYLPFAGFGC